MARKKSENYFSEYVKVAKPDPEKMAALTRAAKGDRTLNEFAQACGVYASTLSRIINRNVTSKCTEQVILAIAENAQAGSGVTLEALLAAQGLAKVQLAEDNGSVTLTLRQEQDAEGAAGAPTSDVKRAMAYREAAVLEEVKKVILANVQEPYVMREKIDVIGLPQMHCQADFALEFAKGEGEEHTVSTWAFVVNNPVRQPAPYRLHQILSGAYLAPYAARGLKVSLVLADKKEYRDLAKRLEGATAVDDISVIFLDRKKRIMEEYVIPKR